MLIQIQKEVPESFTRALLGLSAVQNGFNATEFRAKCRLLMLVQTATDAGFPLWNFSIIKAESANEESEEDESGRTAAFGFKNSSLSNFSSNFFCLLLKRWKLNNRKAILNVTCVHVSWMISIADI